jgi:site-specific DNA recombinase
LTKLKLVTPNPELRAALYRRYSDDVQNDRSIERQTADLEKAAPRLGLLLDERLYFEDRGQSATTLFDRPGLTRGLLSAVEKGLVDVVLVEHTDRLARKGADLFWLAEQFKFHNVKIFTPAGEVSDIQLTFESYQNAADSAKTSFRVRSGHSDAAREGLIPHAAPYGYDDVLGKPGVKAPNASEVGIINRVVLETASRKSPRNIAFDLTRDGIPSPSGGAWTFQTINKILQNELYVGVYVRNKVRKVRNPNNGKRVPRPAPAEDLVTVQMPHLRIVDQDLWDAAQRVRQERAHKHGGKRTEVERPTVSRLMHPFMGLFRCAECGGKMVTCGRGREKDDRYLSCSAAHWRRQCSHSKSYSLIRLSKLTSEKMHAHLTDPDFVNERADLRIKKIIRLTEDDEGEEIAPEVQARYKELRVEQRGLQQRLALLNANAIPPLLPTAIKALARDVDTLHTMLQDTPDDPACRIALGNLIERVLVHPTAANQPYDVSLYARHAAYSGTLPLFPHENHGRSNRGNAVVPS